MCHLEDHYHRLISSQVYMLKVVCIISLYMHAITCEWYSRLNSRESHMAHRTCLRRICM